MKGKNLKEKRFVGVHVEPCLYEQLKKAAAQNSRSVSGEIRHMLSDRIPKKILGRKANDPSSATAGAETPK